MLRHPGRRGLQPPAWIAPASQHMGASPPAGAAGPPPPLFGSADAITAVVAAAAGAGAESGGAWSGRALKQLGELALAELQRYASR